MCGVYFRLAKIAFCAVWLSAQTGAIASVETTAKSQLHFSYGIFTIKKLIYDHRIVDHSFLFDLCDITQDGHFVACGIEEHKNPYPNFVVVYDQHNGQLHKKIKPIASCTAVTISGHFNLVLLALEDGSICGWDLMLGSLTWVVFWSLTNNSLSIL